MILNEIEVVVRLCSFGFGCCFSGVEEMKPYLYILLVVFFWVLDMTMPNYSTFKCRWDSEQHTEADHTKLL